jgi:predicted ATPase/DNA-binding SARP family transcriptional activator
VATDLTLLSPVSFRGLDVTSPRIRGLLALLADDLRIGCSTALLVEGLWPDTAPENALPENPTKAVQILVSRARALLGAEVIVSTPSGYRLGLGEEQVDAAAVLTAVADAAKAARDGDHRSALDRAEAGLALWGGAPEDDPDAVEPLAVLRHQRAATYRRLSKARALALSGLGRHAEAAEALRALFRESPRDEEILAGLLRSEAATQGPSKALTTYDAYRRELRDELGTEPGAALKAVYQELLQNEAPPVRHGVVHDPNPLLGRDEDAAAVVELLRKARVASVVGPGGLGKTRLAHVVARRTDHRLVWFVALAGVVADGDVAAEVRSAIGPQGGGPISGAAGPADDVTQIADALGSGSALLVLDNCEHVTRGAAELVRDLVSRTRNLNVLTTTRTPLGLSSESIYQLPELSLPTTVKLFEQRALAARPDAGLPRAVVEELCRRLDGLPLAVELAAARIRVMAVADIARRLENPFSLLRGGARDAPERHRTLQAVVDWSWNLLASGDQTAMRLLSVFPGGFTVEAAEYLCGEDVLDTLEHLVDQSLLKITDQPSGARFRMLETVREFSSALRDAAGETETAVDGFLTWAREFGLRHHEDVFGPNPRTALGLIHPEQDNLIQAYRYGLARDDEVVLAAGAVLASVWTVESDLGRLAALAEESSWLLTHYRPGPEYVDVTRAAATFAAVYSFFVNQVSVLRHLVTLKRLPAASPDTVPRAMAYVFRALAVFRVRPASSRLEPRKAEAASASSPASAKSSRTWLPGMSCLSSSAVPWATIRPPLSTAIRSAGWSASSRYWVVGKMVTPSSTKPRIACHMPRRLRGSRPVAGSSRKITGGLATSVIARSSRRFMPPEYWIGGFLRASTRSNCSSSSWTRRRPAFRSRWCRSAISWRFSSPVSMVSRAENWPVTPIARRTATASRTVSRPRTLAVPASAACSVVRIWTVVVLPAPLGPSREKTVPTGTWKSMPSRTVCLP